jgi:hypothetical protein
MSVDDRCLFLFLVCYELVLPHFKMLLFVFYLLPRTF